MTAHRPSPFPPGFFDRSDPTDDDRFYDAPRLVTHIDDRAIAAVGELYAELGIGAPGGNGASSTALVKPGWTVVAVVGSGWTLRAKGSTEPTAPRSPSRPGVG